MLEYFSPSGLVGSTSLVKMLSMIFYPIRLTGNAFYSIILEIITCSKSRKER